MPNQSFSINLVGSYPDRQFAAALTTVGISFTKGAFEIGRRAKSAMLEDLLPRLVEKAKELCPVDTGQLRDSITYHVYDGWGEYGSDVHYAIYQELGTKFIPAGRHYLEGALYFVQFRNLTTSIGPSSFRWARKD